MTHLATINLAAGTYREVLTLAEKDLGVGGGIDVVGVMGAIAVDGGTASGTITGYATANNVSGAVLTDSAQAWTADALRGTIVAFTSGPAVNTTYIVVTNTAQALTLSGAPSPVPLVGDSYELREPKVILDSDAGVNLRAIRAVQTGTTIVPDVFQASGVGLRGVRIVRNTSGALAINGGAYALVNAQVISGGSTGISMPSGSIVLRSVFVASNGSGASIGIGTIVFSSSVAGPAFVTTIGSVYARNAGTGAALSLIGAQSNGSGIPGTYESGGTQSGVVSVSNGGITALQSPGFYVRCLTPGTGTGFVATSSNTVRSGFVATWNGNVRIQDCAVGWSLQAAPTAIAVVNPNFVNVTTAISVARGAIFDFAGFSGPTFSGVTNEIQIDGVNYTFANLTAASPQVLSSAYGSRVFR